MPLDEMTDHNAAIDARLKAGALEHSSRKLMSASRQEADFRYWRAATQKP